MVTRVLCHLCSWSCDPSNTSANSCYYKGCVLKAQRLLIWVGNAGLVPQGLIQILLKLIQKCPQSFMVWIISSDSSFFQAGIFLQTSLEYIWEIWQLIKYSALSQYSQWKPWIHYGFFQCNSTFPGESNNLICLLVHSQTCSSFSVT